MSKREFVNLRDHLAETGVSDPPVLEDQFRNYPNFVKIWELLITLLNTSKNDTLNEDEVEIITKSIAILCEAKSAIIQSDEQSNKIVKEKKLNLQDNENGQNQLIVDLTMQKEDLKKQLETHDTRVNELKSEIKELEEENQNLKLNINELKRMREDDISRLNTEKFELEMQLKDKIVEMKFNDMKEQRLSNQIDDAVKESQEKDGDIKELNNKLHEKDVLLKKAKNLLKYLENRVSDDNLKIKRLKAQVRSLLQEKKNQSKNKEKGEDPELKAENDALREKMIDLIETNDNNLKAIDELTNINQDLSQELDKMNESNTNKDKEIQELVDQINALQNEKQQLSEMSINSSRIPLNYYEEENSDESSNEQTPKSPKDKQTPKSNKDQKSPKPNKDKQSPKPNKEQKSPQKDKNQKDSKPDKQKQTPKSSKSNISEKSDKKETSNEDKADKRKPSNLESFEELDSPSFNSIYSNNSNHQSSNAESVGSTSSQRKYHEIQRDMSKIAKFFTDHNIKLSEVPKLKEKVEEQEKLIDKLRSTLDGLTRFTHRLITEDNSEIELLSQDSPILTDEELKNNVVESVEAIRPIVYQSLQGELKEIMLFDSIFETDQEVESLIYQCVEKGSDYEFSSLIILLDVILKLASKNKEMNNIFVKSVFKHMPSNNKRPYTENDAQDYLDEIHEIINSLIQFYQSEFESNGHIDNLPFLQEFNENLRNLSKSLKESAKFKGKLSKLPEELYARFNNDRSSTYTATNTESRSIISNTEYERSSIVPFDDNKSYDNHTELDDSLSVNSNNPPKDMQKNQKSKTPSNKEPKEKSDEEPKDKSDKEPKEKSDKEPKDKSDDSQKDQSEKSSRAPNSDDHSDDMSQSSIDPFSINGNEIDLRKRIRQLTKELEGSKIQCEELLVTIDKLHRDVEESDKNAKVIVNEKIRLEKLLDEKSKQYDRLMNKITTKSEANIDEQVELLTKRYSEENKILSRNLEKRNDRVRELKKGTKEIVESFEEIIKRQRNEMRELTRQYEKVSKQKYSMAYNEEESNKKISELQQKIADLIVQKSEMSFTTISDIREQQKQQQQKQKQESENKETTESLLNEIGKAIYSVAEKQIDHSQKQQRPIQKKRSNENWSKEDILNAIDALDERRSRKALDSEWRNWGYSILELLGYPDAVSQNNESTLNTSNYNTSNLNVTMEDGGPRSAEIRMKIKNIIESTSSRSKMLDQINNLRTQKQLLLANQLNNNNSNVKDSPKDGNKQSPKKPASPTIKSTALAITAVGVMKGKAKASNSRQASFAASANSSLMNSSNKSPSKSPRK